MAPSTPSSAPTASSSTPATPSCPDGMVHVPATKLGEREVATFCIDVTEVTVEAYSRCVAANACTKALTGGLCTSGRDGSETKPINCVEWKQADAYCASRGARLPRESEWEAAAGASDGRSYVWGNEPPEKRACWDGVGNDLGRGNRHDACPVRSYPTDVSPFGAFDMAGSVSEWTQADGARDSGDPNDTNARRGGSWGSKQSEHQVRIAARGRGGWDRYKVGLFVGFRCAR